MRTLLENNIVPESSSYQSATYLEKEYQRRQLEMAARYKSLVDEKLLFENTFSESDIGDDSLDATQEEILSQRREFNERLDNERDEVQRFNNELALLRKYGDDFAYLYRIKEIEDCSAEGIKLELVETPKDYARGTTTDDSYYADLAEGSKAGKNIALKVEIDEETPPFYLSVQQHDNPTNGKRESQLKIAVDDENFQDINKENLQKILAFCEAHGFSTYSADFPFSLDGLDDEDRFHNIFNELKHQAKLREDAMRQKWEKIDSDLIREEVYRSVDNQNAIMPNGNQVNQTNSDNPSAADEVYENFVTDGESRGFWHKLIEKNKKKFSINNVKRFFATKLSRYELEQTLEKKMFEDGLGKERDKSYFKGEVSSGLFGSSWTVYTFFDSPYKHNLAENGRCDKDGRPKFTYSYKLFVTKDSDGGMHFAYHMRDNKKVSEDLVNALVGQFKDFGLTHIRFPKGVPDSDKKLWRIALAEKGIIPVGMSIDRSKAQAMLEAAKKKLSDEEYARYKFNLGKQLEENYKRKGKEPDASEKDFIGSLISSHYYDPFVNAYNAVIKSGLSQKLRKAGDDPRMGAAFKVGAYKAFIRLFNVYDSVAHKGTIAQSPELSEEEVRRIKSAGLDIEPHKLSKEQMTELYELLMPRCVKEADKELEDAMMEAKDVGNVAARGAKRPDNTIIKEVFDAARNGFEDVNERLKNQGCDEISMPKVMGRMQYRIFYERHPEFLRRNTNNNTNTVKPQNQQNSNGANGRNP